MYYKNRLTQILEKYSQLLKDIIETCNSVAWDKIEKLKCFISEQCVKANTMKYESTDNYTFEMFMEKYEESHSFVIDQITELHIFEKFPLWKVNYNDVDESAHLFLFSGNDGYAEVEVIIRSDKTYIIMLEAKPKCSANLEWAGVPMRINSVSDLEQLLSVIQGARICKGCPLEPFKSIIPSAIVNQYFLQKPKKLGLILRIASHISIKK